MLSFIYNTFIEFGNFVNGILPQIYSDILLFSTNHKYIGFYIIFLCGIIFFLYNLIYSLLNLERNIFSFLAFFLFMSICCSYVLGYFYLLKANPAIYLNNLSMFSYYKYILLTVIGSFFIIYFIMKLAKIIIFQKTKITNKVDMKEEIRKILYVWNDSFMGNFCIFLYKKIAISKAFSYIYFSLHFILFYFIRFISLGLLINFVFFGGNLFAFIHTIPLVFLYGY